MKSFYKKSIDLSKNNIYGGGHTYRECYYATNGGRCGDSQTVTSTDSGAIVKNETVDNNCNVKV